MELAVPKKEKESNEVWNIFEIKLRSHDNTFVATARGWDDDTKDIIGEIVVESKSLSRIVEMLAPAKPLNL